MTPNTRVIKMKYLFAAAAASTLLVFGTTTFAAEVVSVRKDNVNVRTGPNTSNPVYMELFQGYPLKVLERKGDWVKISDYENDKGWIHSSLVTKGNTVIVNSKNKANLRSKPTTQSSVVASIERGVILTKVSSEGKWVKVRHSEGTEGWIYKPLIWP
jgi:SH3-like domain-containing protein